MCDLAHTNLVRPRSLFGAQDLLTCDICINYVPSTKVKMNAENDKRPRSALQNTIAASELTIRQADDRFIKAHSAKDCKLCTSGPDIPFSMAFQPIVDVQAGTVVAYEALARGPLGEPASSVLDHTIHNNRYSIDQRCREKAIAVSASLGILETSADLNINFYPNAVYQPKQCLQRTLNAAQSVAFPLHRVIFEITEVEKVRDHGHLCEIMTEYQSHGLRVAIDDFGAGHSGLTLLSEFQPDLIKLDRALICNLDQKPASRVIVRSIAQVCRELDINIVAEGIEREAEMQILCDLGIFTMQGYWFAPPAFEALPRWPMLSRTGKGA